MWEGEHKRIPRGETCRRWDGGGMERWRDDGGMRRETGRKRPPLITGTHLPPSPGLLKGEGKREIYNYINRFFVPVSMGVCDTHLKSIMSMIYVMDVESHVCAWEVCFCDTARELGPFLLCSHLTPYH